MRPVAEVCFCINDLSTDGISGLGKSGGRKIEASSKRKYFSFDICSINLKGRTANLHQRLLSFGCITAQVS